MAIALRATRADEKLAREVAKMALLQEKEFQKKSMELEELRNRTGYPRFQKNSPSEGDDE